MLFPKSPLKSLQAKVDANFSDELLLRLANVGAERVSTRALEFSTQSNLRYDVLVSLSRLFALPLHDAVDQVLLDRGLADRRNAIAHGEFLPVDREVAFELRNEVSSWLDQIADVIVSAARNNDYRK